GVVGPAEGDTGPHRSGARRRPGGRARRAGAARGRGVTEAVRIAAAFRAACRDELEAPKPGNVHVFADGHRMSAGEFIRSAEAAAGPLTVAGARVGARILAAVQATAAAVDTNTNLGIILLCAPLAAAAERAPSDLRGALADVLDALDVEDA